jgi:hypothetical protein
MVGNLMAKKPESLLCLSDLRMAYGFAQSASKLRMLPIFLNATAYQRAIAENALAE